MPLPPDFVLYKALGFSRRIGNYLYLPLFIVCLLAFALAVLEAFVGSAFWEYERGFAYGLLVIGLVSFILWRFSRRLRPILFLVEGTFLGLLTVLCVGWILYVVVRGTVFARWGFLRFLVGLIRFLFVALSLASAATPCIRYWSRLRGVSSAELRAALDRIQDKFGRFAKALSGVPVRSMSFGSATIHILKLDELEPAPDLEIEAGLWQNEWVVIAVENPGGKPIFADTSAEGCPVYLARAEPESWHRTLVADTLDGFFEALKKVAP